MWPGTGGCQGCPSTRKKMMTDVRAEELAEVRSILVDSVEDQRTGVGDPVGS
jgi:hypothetical protein